MNESDRIEMRTVAKEQLRQAGQISDLMNKVDDIHKNQEEFKKVSARLLFLMDNDSATGRKGVVAQTYDLAQRVDKIEDARENEKTKQKIYIGIATFVGGLIMSIGATLFKLIFSK